MHSLGGNQIGDEGAKALARALQENHVLRELNLGCFLERNYVKPILLNRKLAQLRYQVAECEQAIIELDFAAALSMQHGLAPVRKRPRSRSSVQASKGTEMLTKKEKLIFDLEVRLAEVRGEMELRASAVPWLGSFLARTFA
ncbi:Hypothetical Protein FCC1311_109152 [Hondaea fermentalgiana]|uniref:Uncharacterized protein n=1 Tax=Hondaea fermentalgiana TaxID=2315210 RepID=A0A2R5H0V1_9STRA|nr:Hypothetical Protein FCC1311_109152 [Hondaea fermentalgiana]|eukprot:GBG34693.1 Hypothetical Protein FCC1311_109152 [Hondaea fermentalgiana]